MPLCLPFTPADRWYGNISTRLSFFHCLLSRSAPSYLATVAPEDARARARALAHRVRCLILVEDATRVLMKLVCFFL